MRDNKYKNLVEDGEFLYKGMQKKDVNLNFTAEQYSKPAHFIYEIIQNANDAKASSIEFLLNYWYQFIDSILREMIVQSFKFINYWFFNSYY